MAREPLQALKGSSKMPGPLWSLTGSPFCKPASGSWRRQGENSRAKRSQEPTEGSKILFLGRKQGRPPF